MDKYGTIEKSLLDPQYKAGRKLINEGRLEEAVEFFSGLLETRVGLLKDEMHPALAPLYYEYGNALLYNAEESGAVFGDAITDAEKKKALSILEAQAQQQAALEQGATAGSGEGDRSAGAPVLGSCVQPGAASGDASGDVPPTTGDQAAEEDLEIAWENLEMARRIYGQLEITDDIRMLLGKVHLRLGDLNMINGMYNEAAEEFEKCLGHRTVMPDPVSRGVADAHVRRAQALFYASTLEGAEQDKLVASSLGQYRAAACIFENMMARLRAAAKTMPPSQPSAIQENENENDRRQVETMSSTIVSVGTIENEESNGKGKGKSNTPKGPSLLPSSANETAGRPGEAIAAPIIPDSAEDLQDVLDTIQETIETLVSGKDMQALADYKNGTVSTTVGFGTPLSASGTSAEVTATKGFGETAGSAVNEGQTKFGVACSAEGIARTNTMVVKRKGRPAPKVMPTVGGVTPGTEKVGAREGNETSKRGKTEA